MFNHFTKNNGPVFMSNSVSGPSGGSSAAGAIGDAKSLADQGNADTFNQALEGYGLKKEQNELGMLVDAAMKSLHTIQF